MKNNKITSVPVPFYKRAIVYLNIFMLLGQMSLPTLSYAYNAIDKVDVAYLLKHSPDFNKSQNDISVKYIKSEHIVEQPRTKLAQSISDFHKLLLDNKRHALPEPVDMPVFNGAIATAFHYHELQKQVGDRFVQSRLIRSQIYGQLNRNLISPSYADETAQVNQLYQNAFELAGRNDVTFGEKISTAVYNSFGKDFIWPETRIINGEKVLTPVVHLSAKTIRSRSVNGHFVEFTGSDVNFRDITINSGTLLTGRDTYLRTARDLNVNPGTMVASDGDLNLFVGGTLRNHSGSLSAAQNVKIVAGQYEQKTLVHRFSNRYEQGTRFGQIASVNGENINIYSMGDIVVQGGTIDGDNITLRADGNIRLLSQQTTVVNGEPVGKYDHTSSEIEHLTTKLTANDSIYLIASGAIELKAAELHADQGAIDILAGQGVYILNEFNQSQSSKSGKWGKTTEEEQEFQTIAIRSALEAGKSVRIASEFGDVTLQATKIKSGTGTSIDARNGKVHLLLAKEQDHYFYNKVKKGTWKIKTETKQDTVDTAVYNEIIGGVKVNATHGITLELGQYEGETLQETLNAFSGDESLSWMSDLHNDPELTGHIDVAYKKLVEIHKHENKSTLSPAAMAIIAIAVSVAMGPGGAQLIGSSGSIGSFGFISGAAMQAGAVTLATQAATSIANGEGLDGAMRKIYSSEGLRSLAISMATAGVLNGLDDLQLFGKIDPNAQFLSSDTLISIGNQATEAIITATVRAGISTVINGGSFDGFKQGFIDNLKTHAISSLGEGMAKEIGDLVENGQINQAVRYLSHAALGCAIGAATAEVSNSSGSGVACASGAGGAVIGEVIADSFNSQQDYDGKKAALDQELEALGLDINNFDNLTPSEKLKLINSTSVVEQFEALKRIKAQGVDLAKLGAGLSAFIAGGEVNIAADAGENAAQNNAFWFVLQIGYGLYKAYELYQTVESIAELGVELKNAKDDAERNQILLRAATNLGIEIVVGKTASATFGVLIKKARDSGLLPDDALDEAAAIYNRMTEGKLKDYKPGQGQGRKTNPGPEVDNDRHNFPENYEKLPDGTFKGPGGGIFTDSGYTSENGFPIFQRSSGGYFYIGSDGKQVSVRSPREYGDFHKVDDVWASGVKPIQRGRQIQDSVFKNEYEAHGWGNTDKYEVWDDKLGDYVEVKGQNFPLIDFHRGDEVVSLKSINTNGSGWIKRTEAHIEDLSKRGIIGSSGNPVPKANRMLDIRVQPGGLRQAEQLVEFGRLNGIKVTIKEFTGK